MNKAIKSYTNPLTAVPPLFDKVIKVNGEVVDTREYLESVHKEKEVVKKPVLGTTFSRFMDALI